MPQRPKPFLLIVLDGWGYREATEGNAIHAARKPTWDSLWSTYPHTLICSSGLAVGLPEGQMGNSEVGHLNMGAGRIVYQDLTRIHQAIQEGSFFQNAVLIKGIDHAIHAHKAIHILGLLSPGGVHSHEEHIHAALQFAAERGATKVYLHAFLDGRDTPPQSAEASLEAAEKLFKKIGKGQIASITGRYYAMDRDNRWDRTQGAYDLLVSGKAPYHVPSAKVALEMAYGRGETDEFVKPTALHSNSSSPIRIQTGDTVIFMNFRADRARQLTQSLTDPTFQFFARSHFPTPLHFITLTQYHREWKIPMAFPPVSLTHILGEVLSQKGLKQLRLAETEKYAHVTFFFNGGKEDPFPGEERILIPSPKIATYDLQPEMSAPQITEKLVQAIEQHAYDFILCNFANADMVGHSGNFAATVQAIETVDTCLGKIVQSLLKVGGEAMITADHGNAEQMLDFKTRNAHTAHTTFDVPLIYVGKQPIRLKKGGKLSDVTPTLLQLMSLTQPVEMTSQSLIES